MREPRVSPTDVFIASLCSRTLRVAISALGFASAATILSIRRYEKVLTRVAGPE